MKCFCGQELHYTDPDLQATVEDLSKRFGPNIAVTVEGGKTYLVQRHWIALHGIKGKDVAAIGFPEVA